MTVDRTQPLLQLDHLVKSFRLRAANGQQLNVQAVRDVSLSVYPGEILGIVGESGCGKTTLGRVIMRLLVPDAGSITFAGQDITKASRRNLQPVRKNMQMIFQDPFASLNPRMTIGQILAEPFVIHKQCRSSELQDQVAELLHMVGLPENAMTRYPHEFSGGQRQRIGIARAIALRPKLIIADEPVSALDVSIQAEIINLLRRIQAQLNLAIVLITHDMKVVAQVADRVAVMYLGKIMEVLPGAQLLQVSHPYSQALLAAVPLPDPQRRHLPAPLLGDVPSAITPPRGCPFHPRCPYRQARCEIEEPLLRPLAEGHTVACHFAEEIPKGPLL